MPPTKENMMSGGFGICAMEKVNAEKKIAIFVWGENISL
jgi:hypothetical protein